MGLQLLVQKGNEAVGTYEVTSTRYKIGRSGENDLSLTNDSVISRQHAYIEPTESGEWELCDISANGVLLNGTALQKNQPQVLSDGDVVEIGTYRLTAIVSEQSATPESSLGIGEAPRDPLALLTGDSAPAKTDESATGQSGTVEDLINEPVINEAVDLPGFKEDPFAPQPTAGAEDALPDWARATGESPITPDPEQNHPQQQQDPFAAIPPSTPEPSADPFAAISQPPLAAGNHPSPPSGFPSISDASAEAGTPAWPQGNARPAAGSTDASALEALAAGLGLPPGTLANAQQAQVIGSVLRTLLAGVIDILLNRAELKNQMKLQRTILQSQDNNPIKMAPNVESALRWLFTEQQAGFLDAEIAASDVMIDVSAHELSMIAGLQAAQDGVVKALNPDHLEKLFSEQVKVGGIGVLEKSRYWHLFRTYYENEVVGQNMMISTFAEAYEEMSEQVRRREQNERGAR